MLQNPYKKLKIPKEELRFIMPDARKKLFLDMLNEYKKRAPELKLQYVYYNTDSSFSIDYLIIFRAKTANGNVIVFDIPYLYTDRTIPGYRYCKKNDILDDFFYEAQNLMTSLSEVRFYEYLNMMVGLSTDKNSDLYWKDPKNAIQLAKGLSDLSLRFVRKA